MRVGLSIIAGILIFAPFLMLNGNGHRKLTCPTKHVDECVQMYEKKQGTVKKVLSFRDNVVVFLVEDRQ